MELAEESGDSAKTPQHNKQYKQSYLSRTLTSTSTELQ